MWEEKDPELERQEKLFFAVQEKNVEKVRQCLAEGIPPDPVREHAPSNEGNLLKAVRGVNKNDPSDPCIQILSLLCKAQGDKPFTRQRLEWAFLQALGRGLTEAMEVMLPMLNGGLKHEFFGTTSLPWKALELCSNADQSPFGRADAAKMMAWLVNHGVRLETSETEIRLNQSEPLATCLSRANDKFNFETWKKANYARCADVLLQAGAPLVVPHSPRQTESTLVNLVSLAGATDSPYAHWLTILAKDENACKVVETLRSKIEDRAWKAYQQSVLENSLDQAPVAHRPSFRM